MGRPRGCGEACERQGAVAQGRPAGLPSLTGAARQGPRTPQSRGHRPFPQKRFQRRKCSQQNVKGKAAQGADFTGSGAGGAHRRARERV